MSGGVRVEDGRKLRKHQKKLIKMAAQDEVEERIFQVRDRHETFAYYLRYRDVEYDGMAHFPNLQDMTERLSNNPDVQLAIMDILEGLKDYKVTAKKLVQRSWWGMGNAMRGEFYRWGYRVRCAARFKLSIYFVTAQAHLLAADVERVVEKITAAYGRRIMDKLELDISVIESPVYVSPRLGLKALESGEPQDNEQEVRKQVVTSSETAEMLTRIRAAVRDINHKKAG